MDTLSNYLTSGAGTFLAFLGIAITYFVTAAFDKSTGGGAIVRRYFYLAGIFYLALSILSVTIGTAKEIDAGIVLAYMGIGAGLMCTAWSMPLHNKLVWIVFIIGMCFELIGLFLVAHAGLLITETTGTIILLCIIIIFALYLFTRKEKTYP